MFRTLPLDSRHRQYRVVSCSAVEYFAARARLKRHAYALTPVTWRELEAEGARFYRAYIREPGRGPRYGWPIDAGFYVTAAGDFAGLFNASGVPGLGEALAREAPRYGARTLNCFETYLGPLYRRLGWVEIRREPFRPDLAPPGWPESAGAPDVVFMRYAGPIPAALGREGEPHRAA